MKRLHIINQAVSTDNLSDMDFDGYADSLQLKAERLETKRLRRFRQQMA